MKTIDEQITELWDFLTENNLASQETLQIVTSINGYNLETLNNVLYVVTGYRDLEQYTGVNNG